MRAGLPSTASRASGYAQRTVGSTCWDAASCGRCALLPLERPTLANRCSSLCCPPASISPHTTTAAPLERHQRHTCAPRGRHRRLHHAPGTPSATTTPASTTSPAAVPLPPAIERICGDLPIKQVVMEILCALDSHSGAVLQAPPGAGKTSTVPLALLAHRPAYLTGAASASAPAPAAGAPGGGTREPVILVLEPRRVAAKAAARRMAATLGEKVGMTVGYRVRLETCVSRGTRIEVITEGVLLRRLQSDPELEGVGAILFDEFHERNLDADLALAMTCDLQSIARPDLRLLVMSATLGGGLAERCSAILGASGSAGEGPASTAASTAALAPVVTSEGRSYPVRCVYLGAPSRERHALEGAVAEAVAGALAAQDTRAAPRGDVLCFLPGVAEINNTERLLLKALSSRVDIVQLHGGLDPGEQDRVVGHKAGGKRRVILATPIAESSLTLDGVAAVVDSGLRRSPAYDAATGVNRLKTEWVSEASAEQRAGRAGRQGPGVAYRLWGERDSLQPTTTPEIEQADLAPLALQLSCWGVSVAQRGRAAAALPWLDPPPEDRLGDAAQLLQELGAITDTGAVSADGRVMAGMGVHPRLAAMVQRGTKLGATELACVMASLLSERDMVLRGRRGGERGAQTASTTLRLAVLASLAGGDPRDVAGAESTLAALGTMEQIMASVDLAGARRVLMGAYAVAGSFKAQLNLLEDGAAQQQTSANGTGADGAGMRSEGEDGGSESGEDAIESMGALLNGEDMEDRDRDSDGAGEDGAEVAQTSDSLGGAREENGTTGQHKAAPASSSKRRSGSERGGEEAWHRAWLQQAGREGLAGALVALSYPDRLAVRAERSNARPSYALSGGSTVRLAYEDDPLGKSAELLAIAELGGAREGSGTNDSVRLAGPLSRSAVDRYLKDFVTQRNVVFWASATKAVLARQQRRLGRLVLDEWSIPITDEQALPAVLQGFKEMGGVRGVGLSRDLEAWRQRVLWLRRTDLATSGPPASSLPDLSDEALLASAPSWLPPYLMGVRTKADLTRLDWTAILRCMVSRDDAARVEREVPSSVLLPTGTHARIDYSRDPPTASCRIQEVFGLAETPRVAGGRVPVALELLSPGQQPMQITRDLASFWRTSWAAVRKEGKGRYPKHYWPDDPLEAEATRMTKKAMARQAEAAEAAGAAAPGNSKVPSGKGAARTSPTAKSTAKGKKR